MKSCTKCGQTKEDSNFYLEKAKRKDGSIREFRRSHCRACELSRKSKRDKRTKKQRADADCMRKYGITSDIREAMAIRQGGCGICGTKKPGGRSGTWNIDHCHKTGNVRGVLCWECNVGIGKLKDDPVLTRRATQWLEQTEQLVLLPLLPSQEESCEHFFHASLPFQDLLGLEHQPRCSGRGPGHQELTD